MIENSLTHDQLRSKIHEDFPLAREVTIVYDPHYNSYELRLQFKYPLNQLMWSHKVTQEYLVEKPAEWYDSFKKYLRRDLEKALYVFYETQYAPPKPIETPKSIDAETFKNWVDKLSLEDMMKGQALKNSAEVQAATKHALELLKNVKSVPEPLYMDYAKLEESIAKANTHYTAQNYMIQAQNAYAYSYGSTIVPGGGGKSSLYKPVPSILGTLSKAIPSLNEIIKGCPASGCTYRKSQLPISQAIMHLNDYHKWPRNEVADWLESLDVDLQFKVS